MCKEKKLEWNFKNEEIKNNKFKINYLFSYYEESKHIWDIKEKFSDKYKYNPNRKYLPNTEKEEKINKTIKFLEETFKNFKNNIFLIAPIKKYKNITRKKSQTKTLLEKIFNFNFNFFDIESDDYTLDDKKNKCKREFEINKVYPSWKLINKEKFENKEFLKDKKIIFFDDVFTTGTTFSFLIKFLIENKIIDFKNFKNIEVFVISKTIYKSWY